MKNPMLRTDTVLPFKVKKKPFILCVDDERFLLEIIKEQLTNFLGYGIRIEVAENAIEALEVIEEMVEDGYEPGVVISDQIMPEMTGDEFLIKVSKKYPDTYRILLTGLAEKEHVINVINNAGLYRYIAKPWEVNDLNLTVKEAMHAYNNKVEIERQRDQLILLNENLERKVIERTKTIEQKNQVIIDSLNYAKHVQEGILKSEGELQGFYNDSFIFYKPKNIVSGDYYWFYEKDNSFIIVTIDCTGHGISGAMMSMVANNQIQSTLIKEITDPAEMLSSIHDGIVSDLRQKENGIQVGMDASICVIDKDTLKMKYAGARQPVFVVSKGELFQLQAERLSLGGMVEMPRNYITKEHQLCKNDSVYMFTDGYRDQIGGDNGKCMTMKLFRGYIASLSGMLMEEQKEYFSEIFENWKKDNFQTDDILLVGFRV